MLCFYVCSKYGEKYWNAACVIHCLFVFTTFLCPSLLFVFHHLWIVFVLIVSVYASARLWDPLKFGMAPIYICGKCRRPYKTKYTLRRHERFECGLPALYKCEQCDYRAKHKHSVKQHVETVHEKRKLGSIWCLVRNSMNWVPMHPETHWNTNTNLLLICITGRCRN